jgi:cytochrome c biogenesis protein CcmG/thiol:disulfide interchange protein DsbE
MTSRLSLRSAASIVAVVTVGSLFLLLGWRLVVSARGADLAGAVAAGEAPAAPSFDLPFLDGTDRFDSAELRGRPVVLNFWASWCGPCKEEAPILQAASKRYPDLVVLGVNAQDFEGDARRFVERHRLTYRNVRDGSGALLERYGVSGFPETWFIDRKGRLVHPPVQGAITEETLADAIAALGVS